MLLDELLVELGIHLTDYRAEGIQTLLQNNMPVILGQFLYLRR